MRAGTFHVRIPHSMKQLPGHHRHWRVLPIVLGMLLAQVVQPSSLLPLGLAGPTAAHAATDTVSTCDEQSFRAAIKGAASGDTVTFACSGTITLTATAGTIQVDRTLTIDGAGQSVTLSGGGALQLFNVTSGGNLAIDNLTVTDGSTVGSGGAISSNGTLTIDHSTFTGNTATVNGGAIAASGALTVTNSTFSGNSATSADSHSGAIDANDPPGAPATIIKGDTFTGNSAAFGGAMAFGTNNPVDITNSTLTGNSVASNSVTPDGGALYTYAPLTLSFSTVANNTGGPAIGFNTSGPAGLKVAGSILDNASNCGNAGLVSDDGFNLTFQGNACALTAASDIQGKDPLLGNLASNGGPTQTLAPSPDSPAIGGSTNCNDTSGSPVTTDQRGASRPATHCTIGAYEADGANGTWVNAQTLDQTSGGDEVNQTVSQHIYTRDAERWYKFLVTPGSTVQIQYSGLPGTVVSLHSDVQAEYNMITNTTNTAISSAQNASSGFLPQQFLPQQFLPQQFLPQQFLPQQFLPQQFLPQQFLPQQFLPQQFLPQQFLPQQFLPAPYSGAAYASLLAASAVPNSTVQSITHNTWNAFGYWYVRVAGPASLSTPFSLTVTETGGICSGVTVPSFTPPSPSSLPSGLTSLILWDSTRISGSSTDISTLGSNLNAFASRPDVGATVADLSTIPGIDGAGSTEAQADANPGCPLAKNIAANDIKAVIQSYRTQNPGLKYIVLVGDDHSIPYFRYPDESGLGPENQYYPPVADTSASNASLRNNLVLGQDAYGSSVDLPVGDLSLPVPDLAVGRLVRTAAEVSNLLTAYTANQGQLTPQSSLVTGYDFVADAATSAAADLQAGTGVAPATLISPQGQSPAQGWTANQLRQQLFGSRHDIVFLAGHFSAGALEAADYSTSVGAAEVASSSVSMSNSLVLALGCHGGFSIPGGDAIPNLSPSPDWTEAIAEKGATLLASTGYAYGDTVLTEYGEHLFDNFVHQLRYGSGPVALGQAEVAAKKEYLATHTNLTGVDEKTLLETSLYGLPMFGVNMPAGRISSPTDSSIVSSAPTVSSGPGAPLSLATSDIDVMPALTTHTSNLSVSGGGSVTATYLTGPSGNVVRPGEPIFPSASYNVHAANLILRGVGFRGGSYSDVIGVTPLTSAAGTETSVGHPAFYTNVFYPTQLGTPNFFGAIGGGAEHLDTTPAQYISSSPASTSGTSREFSDLRFRLFYLPNDWNMNPSISPAAEAAPSQITGVSANADASGSISFNVHVSSDQTAGTQAAWVTYTDPANPGTWKSIDLTQSVSDSTLWTATQSLPADIEFMVQATNGAGLVTLSTDSGAYYTVGTSQSTTIPTTVTVQSPPSSGVFNTQSSTFQVHLDAGGTGLSGQAVTVQVGTQEGLATTDANGNASVTVPLNEAPGTYSALATFAGGTANTVTYLPSSSTASSFTVTAAHTTLALATPTAIYGGPATVTATLKDDNGIGLVQRTVLFTVTGNGQTYNKTAITDYLGQAVLSLSSLAAGNYSVTASFGGADHPVMVTVGGNTVTESDPDYLTSTAGPATLPVQYVPATTNGVTNMCDGDLEHTMLQPINPDGSSVFKQGSTIPVKFRVCDINGNSVGLTATASTVVTSFTVTKVGSSNSSVDETENSTTPDTAFRWDTSNQQWIFNLSSNNLSSTGGYRFLATINLNDGTSISQYFSTR